MELTSGGLLSLLVMVAAGVMGTTVWLWPRYPGRAVRPVLYRTALLISSQLTLAAFIVAWANSYFLWYVTWGDILGQQQPPPKPVHKVHPHKPSSGIVNAQVPATNPLEHTPALLWDKTRESNPAKYGRLENVKVSGARTGYDQQAYVLLPPEYYQPQFAQRKFPVVIMLAGYPGSTKSLIDRVKLPDWADRGRAAHQLQPTIYVMMQPTVVPPRDTECTDMPAGPQAAAYFALDVPEALAGSYRVATTRSGWGIMGGSTGGYCAAKIAMTYSDRFGSAVNLDGHFVALKDATTGDLWGGSRIIRDENDLIWRLQHMPPPPINLLITSSKNGERSYPQAVQFMSLAKPPLNLDEIILESGGHNYDTWARVFPAVLKWMSQHQTVG